MIADTFYWILNMSLVAALTAGCLMLLRRVKRLPRRWICALWLLPGVRAIIPFSLSGGGGLVGLLNRLSAELFTGSFGNASNASGSGARSSLFLSIPWFRECGTNAQALKEGILPDLYTANAFQLKDWSTLTEAEYGQWKSLKAAQFFTIGGLIWLIVALALLLCFAILYGITLHELKDAKPLDGRKGVFVSDRVTAPALYGIFRPRIILPDAPRPKEQLELILLHEETHRKRGDNFWRLLTFLLAAVHWFNPLSWLCLKCVPADLELACDEAVLGRLGEGSRKAYALALVGEAERKNMFSAAFGGAPLRIRIDRILSWKRLSLLAGALLAALFAALAWFLLINPTS